MKIWSKPAFRILPQFMMKQTTMVGTMEGSVMLSICLHLPAPSMEAASYSYGSMPLIAAK